MAKPVNNMNYELNAIKRIIESRDPQLLSRFNRDHFGHHDTGGIYTLVQVFYASHGEMIGWDGLVSEVATRVKDVDACTILIDLIGTIKDRDIQGVKTDLIHKELNNSKILRQVLSGSQALATTLTTADAEGAITAIQELYVNVTGTMSDVGFDLNGGDVWNLAGKDNKFNFRKTGIDGIDRRGGRIEGGLTLLGAVAKAGKSTLAQKFITHSHKNYTDGGCAYFTWEQGQVELLCRFLADIGDINIGLLVSDMLTPEERIRKRIAQIGLSMNITDNMLDMVNDKTYVEMNDLDFYELFKPTFAGNELAQKLYLFEHAPDWDNLFIQMDMLNTQCGVVDFAIDYPHLIGRGMMDRHLQTWEYNLQKIQELKAFARQRKCFITAPMQYDDTNDKLKFVSNAVNACDLYVALNQEEGDEEIGTMGAVTATIKAMRNFLSIPGEPSLTPFKLLKKFNYSRFENFNFDLRD